MILVDATHDSTGILLRPADGDLAAVSRALGSHQPPLRARRLGRSIHLGWADACRLERELELPLRWAPSTRQAIDNRSRIADAAPRVLAQARSAHDTGAARQMLQDTRVIIDLDDHQVRNVAAMTIPDGWGTCVFDEQGTGKTVTVIGAFDVLVERGLVNRLLIAAPKSMVAEWEAEFHRFCGDLYRVAVVQGDRRSRAAAIADGADVIVCGYETVIAHQAALERLARRTPTALVVDESFAIKNELARRTQSLRSIREWCRRAYVLCGTPAPNRPRDIIAQFDLVDLGLTFHDSPGDLTGDAERGYVAARMANAVYTRNRKLDVLELPDRSFTDVKIDLAPEQARLYAETHQGMVADLDEIDELRFARDRTTWLARRAALLRICSNPGGLQPGWTETPAKLAALDGLLARLADDGEKVIVWSFYRASLDAIAARYRHLGLVRVDGSINDTTERREAVRRFQQDSDVRVFLGNPAAAGAGLTLHAARIAIYESLSNQAAHWMQSLDRIHRRGQDRAVEYISLVCRDTIEPGTYQRLVDKSKDQAILLGDADPTPQTRDALLAELTTVGVLRRS